MMRVILAPCISAALALLAGCGSGGNGASSTVDGGADASTTADGSTAGDDATTGEDGRAPALDAGADVDAWKPLPPTPDQPQLWYWHHSYLSPTSTTEPAASEQLIDQAAAAGYTGLAFWDSALTFANRQGWSTANLATVVKYEQSKGLTVLAAGAPIGYSNDMLEESDPNLAEGAKVVGGQFTVTGGALVPVNTLAPLQNPGFEGGKTVWFGTGDARTGVDTTVAHSGSASGVIQGNATATDNARFTQAMTVTPWRLYHVQRLVQDVGLLGQYAERRGAGLQDAGQHHADVAKSVRVPDRLDADAGLDRVRLRVQQPREHAGHAVPRRLGRLLGHGVDRRRRGRGNVARERAALHGHAARGIRHQRDVRRGGRLCRRRRSRPSRRTPGTYDPWHTPPVVAVPSGSKLQAAATVSMDYYTVVPQIGWEVSSCLTDPAIQAWNKANAMALAPVFPKGTGVFLGYDEMRQGDSCEECRATNLTGGQLLAQNLQQTVLTLQGVWGLGHAVLLVGRHVQPVPQRRERLLRRGGRPHGLVGGLPPGAVIKELEPHHGVAQVLLGHRHERHPAAAPRVPADHRRLLRLG